MTGDTGTHTRGRPKTFDRARTLALAIDSYWRDGVDAVAVNEICRRAKISKPDLYREFGDEDHLMNAVGEDPVLVRAHAHLAFASLTTPSGASQ